MTEVTDSVADELIYLISHDLQEPLRMVSSYLQLLDKKYSNRLDENAREYIKFAVDGSLKMKKMLEALLKYSRISNSQPRHELIDLKKILNKVKKDLELQYKDKNFKLSYKLPDKAELISDPILIHVLFYNLIENAVKFNNKNTEIIVENFHHNSHWAYSVNDNGIGIDEVYHDKIFGMFRKLNNDYPGIGVGLALCKKIVEKLGGEIWIESRERRGARFNFTISKNS